MNDAAVLRLAEQTPRPKGVTKRQMRLAALLPRCETAAEAMRKAGYPEVTIDGKSGRQTGLVGVKKATIALQLRQADSARGLMSFGIKGLASADADLQQLDPRDRFAVSFKAIELGNTLGENLEIAGDGQRWDQRVRRACLLMARLTEQRIQRGLPPNPKRYAPSFD